MLSKKSKNWVSLVPYGLNQQHPNAYRDMAEVAWENRDNLAYAWRILRDGCCDGCALGTTGMRDWTMKGIHLCAVRLNLLRLNTMPAMDWRLLEDVGPLRKLSERKLRKLGRLAVPMVRRKGENGFTRIAWDEAVQLIAERLRGLDPRRVAWYITSRGLTNEAYYAHQKVARFIGTNNVDTSARVCHAPSTLALSETVGCAATTCSYSDWIGCDLIVFVGSNIANNQPVATKYLCYAKDAGSKVFLVNPYFEPGMERYWVPSVTKSALFGTRITDDFFQVHTGGDIPFFYGVMKHLIENGWVDREFVAARTVGWEDIERKVARELMIRLPDKRVLDSKECCDDCIEKSLASIQTIRAILIDKQVELVQVHDGSLYLLIEFMAEGVRQFLTITEPLSTPPSPQRAARRFKPREEYFAALEQLRFHLHSCLQQVAKIAEMETPKVAAFLRSQQEWEEAQYLRPKTRQPILPER